MIIVNPYIKVLFNLLLLKNVIRSYLLSGIVGKPGGFLRGIATSAFVVLGALVGAAACVVIGTLGGAT